MSGVIRAIKTPVTLLLLLAFVGFAAKWGLERAREEIPDQPRLPCVVQTVGPKLKPSHVVVYVYNATDRNGLAKRAGQVLLADGFKVLRRVNAEEKIEKTTIVGVEENSPEVVLVRSYLPKAKFVADGRPDHSVDLLLGEDFKEFNSKPMKSVPLPDETACLPQEKPLNTRE